MRLSVYAPIPVFSQRASIQSEFVMRPKIFAGWLESPLQKPPLRRLVRRGYQLISNKGTAFEFANGAFESIWTLVGIEDCGFIGHGIQNTSFSQSDHRTSCRDCLDWHDAKVLDPGEEQRVRMAE